MRKNPIFVTNFVKFNKNVFRGYYLTITESKRRIEKDGRFAYDKHKIFLYKEDFEKFSQGLEEVIAYIKERCPVVERTEEDRLAPREREEGGQFSNVDFEEL